MLSAEALAYFVLQKINWQFLFLIYLIVLFETFLQTGTGFIPALNQRIQSALQARGKELPKKYRPAIAFLMITLSLLISTFGLISLIAKGYESLAWGISIIFYSSFYSEALPDNSAITLIFWLIVHARKKGWPNLILKTR